MKAKLEAIAGKYDPSTPEKDFDYWFLKFGAEAVCRNLAGGKILELGCGVGVTTEILAHCADRLDVVEGSIANIETTSKRLGKNGKIHYHRSLWEDYKHDMSRGGFTDVVLMNGLDHIDDPTELLIKIQEWLPNNNRLHVIVNNARSLHRRIGVAMGLIPMPSSATALDKLHGHRRVGTCASLIGELNAGGWHVDHLEGILLKPFSNKQMQALPEDLIRDLLNIGMGHPEMCGQIYAIARRL